MLVKAFSVAALWMAAALVAPAVAQETGPYPNKPIRVVLPFPAGGPGDTVARKIGADLSTRLGVPLIMDNKVGGTGVVGQDIAMRSPPDGYTLVAISISGVLAYHFQNRQVDFTRDFAMLGQVYSQYGLIVVNPAVPSMAAIRNMKDLLNYARANPGKLDYASQGSGSIGHLVMERIKTLTGVNLVHVPYRGSGPAYNDLLAGHIPMMSSSLGALPYIRAGKLRAIAVGSPKRISSIPDVPTFVEEGINLVAGSWYGFAAPAGTPPEIVKRLSTELSITVARPDVAEHLRNAGTEPEFVPGPEFAARANTDFREWGQVIRELKIKPD